MANLTNLIKLAYVFCCFCISLDIKKFDPAHIRTVFHEIQCLSASENKAKQRLLENCRRAGLRVHGHTPADGNCFFHAVADQLFLLGLQHQSAEQLRNDIILYLRYHPQVEVSKAYSFSDHVYNSINGKSILYCKSHVLVHEYWTILGHNHIQYYKLLYNSSIF